jgi:hypothetical protein
MCKISIILAAATAVIAGTSLFTGNTQAAVVVAPNSILSGADALNPVQNVQVFLGWTAILPVR